MFSLSPSENDLHGFTELLTVASSIQSQKEPQESVASSVAFFTMSNEICWLPFRDGTT